MVKYYVTRIAYLHNMTIDEVPLMWRAAVQAELDKLDPADAE